MVSLQEKKQKFRENAQLCFPKKQLVLRVNWSYFFKACFLPTVGAEVLTCILVLEIGTSFGNVFDEAVVIFVELFGGKAILFVGGI